MVPRCLPRTCAHICDSKSSTLRRITRRIHVSWRLAAAGSPTTVFSAGQIPSTKKKSWPVVATAASRSSNRMVSDLLRQPPLKRAAGHSGIEQDLGGRSFFGHVRGGWTPSDLATKGGNFQFFCGQAKGRIPGQNCWEIPSYL